MIGPALEEIATSAGECEDRKVNVDENPGIAGQLGNPLLPTLMLLQRRASRSA
jgi:thioredoxin 1